MRLLYQKGFSTGVAAPALPRAAPHASLRHGVGGEAFPSPGILGGWHKGEDKENASDHVVRCSGSQSA